MLKLRRLIEADDVLSVQHRWRHTNHYIEL